MRFPLRWRKAADELREGVWRRVEDLAEELKPLQAEWASRPTAPVDLAAPLFVLLLRSTSYASDGDLVRDVEGYPLLGVLPSSGPDTTRAKVREFSLTIDEQRRRRVYNNHRISASLRASEYGEDILCQCHEHADLVLRPTFGVVGLGHRADSGRC
jgi:hypothetical protein